MSETAIFTCQFRRNLERDVHQHVEVLLVGDHRFFLLAIILVFRILYRTAVIMNALRSPNAPHSPRAITAPPILSRPGSPTLVFIGTMVPGRKSKKAAAVSVPAANGRKPRFRRRPSPPNAAPRRRLVPPDRARAQCRCGQATGRSTSNSKYVAYT